MRRRPRPQAEAFVRLYLQGVTVREIAHQLTTGRNRAYAWLGYLVAQGRLQHRPRQPTAIKPSHPTCCSCGLRLDHPAVPVASRFHLCQWCTGASPSVAGKGGRALAAALLWDAIEDVREGSRVARQAALRCLHSPGAGLYRPELDLSREA